MSSTSKASNSFNLYIGSYTDFDSLAHLPANKCVGDGVYCLQFNNGNIIPKYVIKCYNPAVLSFHPNSTDIIYALTEGIVDDGIINAYNIDRNNNKIKEYGKWSTKGKSLCYFKVDPVLNKYGIAINYWEGSLDLFELNKSGKIVKHLKHINHNNLSLYNKNVRRQVKNREDHWEHRQCGSHAHSIHYHGNNVFIPDLGENAIFQYKFNPYASDLQNILVYQTQLKLKHGCGPRHMVFNPKLNTAYVSNELNSSIVVLKIAKGNDETQETDSDTSFSDEAKDMDNPIKSRNNDSKCNLKILQYIDTYDKNDKKYQNTKNYVAEIAISHDYNYVYLSNRGVDTIAIYQINPVNGKLKYISEISVYGKTPRHFVITPDNKYIISANQDSNNLIIFERNIKTGLLKLHKKYDTKEFAKSIPNFTFNAPNYILCDPNPLTL